MEDIAFSGKDDNHQTDTSLQDDLESVSAQLVLTCNALKQMEQEHDGYVSSFTPALKTKLHKTKNPGTKQQQMFAKLRKFYKNKKTCLERRSTTINKKINDNNSNNKQ